MENNEKNHVVRSVLKVFGIIFSIILVPGLILGILVGGTLLGLSGMVSRDSIARLAEEAKLAEYVLERVEAEVVNEVQIDEVKPEYVRSLTEELITVQWVDSVITEVLDALYSGRTPKVTLDSVEKTLEDRLKQLQTDGFSDVYSAWKNETPSVYFKESFVQSFIDTLEQDILTEYKQMEADSLEELEKKYDAYYGTGAFAKLVDGRVQDYRTTWDEEFSKAIDEMLSETIESAEKEVNEALAEVAQDADIRMAVDYLKEFEAKASVLKIIVYGVIFGAVLLLVSCFWFGPTGFMVTALPLAIGGGFCKSIGSMKTPVLKYIKEFVANDADLSEFGDVINSMVTGVLTPLLDELSSFGNIILIAAVALLGLAIMSGVIRKNKSVQNTGNVVE